MFSIFDCHKRRSQGVAFALAKHILIAAKLKDKFENVN